MGLHDVTRRVCVLKMKKEGSMTRGMERESHKGVFCKVDKVTRHRKPRQCIRMVLRGMENKKV